MTTQSTLRQELQRLVTGEVLVDDATLEQASTNFGRLNYERPAVVVRPAGDDDVAAVLKFATSSGVPVTCRGGGFSQDRQNLDGDGIVLDASKLAGVIRIDRDADEIVMQGGTRWSDALSQSFPLGLCPRVLTGFPDATVAGTLSIAGTGPMSHRYGSQANNVNWMDVATPRGEILRCSASENTDLFDCVRSGIGQFGVILRVGFPLRRCGKLVTMVSVAYEKAEQLFEESLSLVERDVPDHIEGGLYPGLGGRELLVNYGVESDDEASEPARRITDIIGNERVRNVRTEAFWNADGTAHHFLIAPIPDFLMLPGTVRPFFDEIVSVDLALEMLAGLQGRFADLVTMGHIAIFFGTSLSGRPAPLWRLPKTDKKVGIGVFPFFEEARREQAAQAMQAFGRFWDKRGGKRYVSGYLGYDTVEQWEQHFGEVWPWFREMKQKFDPAGIMNTRMLPQGWAGARSS